MAASFSESVERFVLACLSACFSFLFLLFLILSCHHPSLLFSLLLVNTKMLIYTETVKGRWNPYSSDLDLDIGELGSILLT